MSTSVQATSFVSLLLIFFDPLKFNVLVNRSFRSVSLHLSVYNVCLQFNGLSKMTIVFAV